MNSRKQIKDLGEPLPRRIKPAKYGASTIRSTTYENRRYGNSSVERTQRGKPQRQRRFNPYTWTKENAMSLTKDNRMMRPHQGIGGSSGGPPLNKYKKNNMHHSQMNWLMQKPSIGGPSFTPQPAGAGGLRVPPPNIPNMHSQMPQSGNPPLVQPDSMMRSSTKLSPHAPQTPELSLLNKINIGEVFQNLVSSGVLGPGGVIAPNSTNDGVLPSAVAPEEKAPQSVALKPSDLDKQETIETRQPDKNAEEAPAPHPAPRNWTEWKALKLQLGQPSKF